MSRLCSLLQVPVLSPCLWLRRKMSRTPLLPCLPMRSLVLIRVKVYHLPTPVIHRHIYPKRTAKTDPLGILGMRFMAMIWDFRQRLFNIAIRQLHNATTIPFPGLEMTRRIPIIPALSIPSPLFDHNVFSDPADFTNDVFLPGSAYEALHKTLRNRQLWTAQLDVPSRRSSQGSVSLVHTGLFSKTERQPRGLEYSKPFELSPEREHTLWENYLNEICSWVT